MQRFLILDVVLVGAESGLDMSLDIYGTDTFEGYYKNWKDTLPSNIKDRISQIKNNKWNLTIILLIL